MKLILHVSFLCLTLLVLGVSTAQVAGGEKVFNPEGIHCVSAEEYEIYHAAVSDNLEQLTQQGLRLYQNNQSNSSEQQPSFIWPVQQVNLHQPHHHLPDQGCHPVRGLPPSQ